MVSCQDKEDEMVMKGNNEPSGSCYRVSALYSTKHTIPVEEAEKNALQMMENLYGSGNGLKSGHKRAVENVQVITKAKSSLKSCNSQLPDTLAYVVSFADSAGFSIVSADDRVVTPVLACIEKGTYGDGANIPGFQLAVKNAQNYIAASIEDFEENKEACLYYLKTHNDIPVVENDLKAKATKVKGPYLSTKWGQESPYNMYSPICSKCGENSSVTGCFPTAMAQIMAYYRHGIFAKSRWDSIWAMPEVARMIYGAQVMREIGRQNNAEYCCGGCGGTAVIQEWYPADDGVAYYNKWIDSQGFVNKYYSYSWDKLKSFLERRPVLMSGKCSEGGHSWIADGYKVVYTKIPLFSNLIIESLATYYAHINWGWSGRCDGYFDRNCFRPANAVSYDDPSLSNYSSFNFDTKLRVIEIYPKN